MKQTDITNLNNKGFTILKNWVDKKTLNDVRKILPKNFAIHKKIRIKNNNGIVSDQIAMNVLASDDFFINFLQKMIERGLIKDLEEHYFKNSCILNSFSALSNIPSESSLFYKKFHRDIKIYSHSAPVFLNMLVMVDDFTVENGGTLLLPFSHLKEAAPTKEFWKKNSVSMTGSAGDIVLWNGNIFHASGINKTLQDRRGLPITFTLPYYKQLLDYPRALGYDRMSDFSLKMQDILGYNSRVPSSVEEWYRPMSK
ncbi:phytanoyl-CoA dioxygenase family protein [Flavobacteriaceae bacterium]|nr:phytanoyl-CoA dioxygenase family protein [Flavobacteriaceae bacterium]